jgi:glycosyltransferase involved in cell wall biosynthesis
VNRPLRVLYVAHSVSSSGGGMERQSNALVNFGDESLDFTVIASDGLDELPSDVSSIRVRLPQRPAVVRIVWFYFFSARHVRRLRPQYDVVHSCGAVSRASVDLATVHLCHAAVKSDSRSTLHGWRKLNAGLARRAGLAIERRQYRKRRVRRLVAVSPQVERELAQWYPDVDRDVVANGVDVAKFSSPPRTLRSSNDVLRTVMVTGDFALKGVDLALIALVRSPRVVLRVVGRGALEAYRAQAVALGVSDRVEFLGQLSDVRPIYAESDVALCVSNYESFGLYLVEAALAGCTLISTNVGVSSQLIGANEGGLAIEHDEMSLANALNALQSDPERVRECAQFCAQQARQFSLTAMSENYVDQYRKLTMDHDDASVLHVGLESPELRMGGLNRYLDELATAEREIGMKVTRTWVGETTTASVEVVTPGLSWPQRLRAFARIIRRSDAEIVDVHFAAHASWALLSGALRGRPLVVHFQGPWALESATSGDGALSVRIKLAVERYVLRRADAVVTLSNAFRLIAIERYGVSPHRIEVVAPGVTCNELVDRSTLRDLLGVAPETHLIVAVRRLVARTGVGEALELFAEIRRDKEQLVIVGDGPLRQQLERRVVELQLDDSVFFTGRVDDEALAQWYRAADVTLVPSVAHEGFGLVVYESLSFGTPVVASNIDGLTDAARGCEAVQLIELTKTALRSALDGASEPGLRSIAREFAETKAWTGVADTQRRLYRRIRDLPAPRGVVVLDHTARPSGGELAIAKMASALNRDQWRMHVILAEHGAFEQELVQRGISFEVLEMDSRTRSLSRDGLAARGRLAALWATVSYSWKIRRIVRRRRPAVVHSNSMKAHVYGSLASVFAPWSFVMHVRDHWEPPYVNAKLATVLRTMARMAPDAIVANSWSTALSVSSHAFVLPSPTEDDFFAVSDVSADEGARLAVIGRLAPWKGQDLAIRALASVRELAPATLTLMGDALFGEESYVQSLHDLAAELGVTPWVNFLGHVDDVASHLDSIDISILTSRSPEPFGNVVIEAMAAGRAVVVPDRGGVTEFVISSGPLSNGLFYEMDNVDSLSAVLRRLVVDGELRRWLGRNARVAADAFRADALAVQLEEIYESLQ